MVTLETLLLALALAVALWLRPWRLLADGRLAAPLLGTLVLLPWVWALPWLHAMPLQFQLSGAALVVLMLGWPLAVPVLVAVGAASALLGGAGWAQAVHQTFWSGVLPATLALALGGAIRRWLPHQVFVFILGRGFLGTALAVFGAALLGDLLGASPEQTRAQVGEGLSLVGHWLMAWGDAFMTGMLCAIFVAFRPQWLATWSDQIWLRRPGA